MAKKPLVEDWEIGHFFGATVVRGYIRGQRVVAQFRYWSHGYFGITRSDNWIDEKWKVGHPALTAFDELKE